MTLNKIDFHSVGKDGKYMFYYEFESDFFSENAVLSWNKERIRNIFERNVPYSGSYDGAINMRSFNLGQEIVRAMIKFNWDIKHVYSDDHLNITRYIRGLSNENFSAVFVRGYPNTITIFTNPNISKKNLQKIVDDLNIIICMGDIKIYSSKECLILANVDYKYYWSIFQIIFKPRPKCRVKKSKFRIRKNKTYIPRYHMISDSAICKTARVLYQMSDEALKCAAERLDAVVRTMKWSHSHKKICESTSIYMAERIRLQIISKMIHGIEHGDYDEFHHSCYDFSAFLLCKKLWWAAEDYYKHLAIGKISIIRKYDIIKRAEKYVERLKNEDYHIYSSIRGTILFDDIIDNNLRIEHEYTSFDMPKAYNSASFIYPENRDYWFAIKDVIEEAYRNDIYDDYYDEYERMY